VIFLNPYNTTLIFDIEMIGGKFNADNRVHGEGRMDHKITNNEIGELDAVIGMKTADLQCYPGFIGGDFSSGNEVSESPRLLPAAGGKQNVLKLE